MLYSCAGKLVINGNNQLVYILIDREVVKCTDLNGDSVFSYKNDRIQKVRSLTVSSSGVIFAGDEDKCVHVIDKDGKHRKMLIQKFEKIQNVRDMWLDNSKKRLFICGDVFVEMFDIVL